MRLVILAAGDHKRLPALDCPKALIEFGGLTITEMVIRDFAKVGVDKVAICVGYQANKIMDRIGDSCFGADVYYYVNENYATTGAAASLAIATPFFRGRNCVIMEGDHLLHPDLPKMLVESECENVILYDPQKPEMSEETIVLAQDGRVRGIVWPASRELGAEYRYVVGEAIVMAKLCKTASAVLPMLLGTGEIIAPLHILMRQLFYTEAISTGGLPWIEIDTPDDLERAGVMYDQILKGDNQ